MVDSLCLSSGQDFRAAAQRLRALAEENAEEAFRLLTQ